MSLLTGFTIARAIPLEVMDGLLLGRYVLSGGVIRGAPGTEIAGQIVRHLLPAATNMLDASSLVSPVNAALNVTQVGQLHNLSQSVAQLGAAQAIGNAMGIGSLFSPVNTALNISQIGQLRRISKNIDVLGDMTKQILGVATTTMAISGLNLALSATGFVFLSYKMSSLNKKVDAIAKDVREIRSFLELTERAELESALRDLAHASQTRGYTNRRDLLMGARRVLSPISLKYAKLYGDYAADKRKSLEELLVCEEYFAVSLLASVHSAAELDMVDVASRDLEDGYRIWQEHTRHVVAERLLVKQPERFLYSDYAKTVSSNDLVSWLNFVHDPMPTDEWIDQLRFRLPQSRHFRIFAPERPFKSKVDIKEIIPALHKLVSRNNVMEGYLSQYEVMRAQKLKPSAIQQRLESVSDSDKVDGYVILEPEKRSPLPDPEPSAEDNSRRLRWF
jgi:hypothetical protein